MNIDRMIAINIALAAQGDAAAQAYLQHYFAHSPASVLNKRFQKVIGLILTGERDPKQLLAKKHKLAKQDHQAVHLALRMLDSPELLETIIEETLHQTEAGDFETEANRIVLLIVGAAQGDKLAIQTVQNWLADEILHEEWIPLTKVVPLFLAGERNIEVLMAHEPELDGIDQELLTLMIELVDDPEKLMRFAENLENGIPSAQLYLNEDPEPIQIAHMLAMPIIHALLGPIEAKRELYQQLDDIETDNVFLEMFIQAAQRALTGIDLHIAFPHIDGEWGKLWATIILHVETDNIEYQLLTECVNNTILCFGREAARRGEWIESLYEFWIPYTEYLDNSKKFIKTLIKFIESGGNPKGLGINLTQNYQWMFEDIVEHTRPLVKRN